MRPMIEHILKEIDKALDNEMYFSALSLCLILIDTCSKAEFDRITNKNKKRFTIWYDKYIGLFEDDGYGLPYMSGETVYQLRCFVFHQSTPNVKNIDKFRLIASDKEPLDIYGDSCAIESDGAKVYNLNLRRFCLVVTSVVREYYKNNKEKFSFIKYEIIHQ